MDPTLAELARSLRENGSASAREQSMVRFRSRVAGIVRGRASYAPGPGAGTPDVWTDGTGGPPALSIKVVLWDGRSLAARVTELSAAGLALRRNLGDDGRLGLLLVVLPAEPATDLSGLGPQLAGTGFDRIAVGVATPEGGWSTLDRNGVPTPVADLDAAVAHLRTAEEPPPPSAPDIHPAGSDGADGASATRFLLVADEWHSEAGGISTLNRELAVALAEVGVDVRVMVPTATQQDRDAALKDGVQLVAPDPVPGITGKELLLTRPGFDDEPYRPDVIVGHGRILGPYAYAAHHHYFPTAKRVHVVHMDPDRLGQAKEEPGGPSLMVTSDERRELEVQLAITADLVAGVGPHLSRTIDNLMRGRLSTRPPVFTLIPGLRDWGGVVDLDDLPDRRQVLLMARAEDVRSKGLDIAVNMVKRAIEELGDSLDERPALVIRGVRPEDADEVKARLDPLASPELEVFLRTYSPDEAMLRNDLWASRAVIMPSRHEGFGLAAYEAIAAGVPVLITAESGLAQLLTSQTRDGERRAPREVLRVRGGDSQVVETWAQALYETLVDPVTAFGRAAELRGQLLERVSWRRTALDLLARLGYPADPS
ncbi:hypothetical protein C6361_00275 [Plantactinospora sp. BC1]|uniref:glycosyltransferase family 4 protein n=1 Tax=Plantactinospora sp. BC1 TaxID=2108470 RepID=UPI000D164D7D|nr:glycosyltransferase [Plantactinospora sp. BC1]AVT28190.1 hypothetical protein C6361_00275 [Plantactinospora sp. BC1]